MDYRSLYQEVLLEHNKKPRNFGVLAAANRLAHGRNPLCGDEYTVRLILEDGVVRDIKFEGTGCAISMAAASMMTARVKGKRVEDAEALIAQFRGMMIGELDVEGDELLGHLKVFEGAARLPNRIKCAMLPWHALGAAISGEEITSTEGSSDEWGDGGGERAEEP